MSHCSHLNDCFYHKIWKELQKPDGKKLLERLKNAEQLPSGEEYNHLMRVFIYQKLGVALPELLHIRIRSKAEEKPENNPQNIHYLYFDEEWPCGEELKEKQFKSRW